MEGESPTRVTTPAGAVFLSYASQDAEAAARICAVLRASGIEVWFDQSELRGGEAWDRQIRQQIHDCRLFIPVISANSEQRDEGYFRRNIWRRIRMGTAGLEAAECPSNQRSYRWEMAWSKLHRGFQQEVTPWHRPDSRAGVFLQKKFSVRSVRKSTGSLPSTA
jgi:hypothetical protein